MAGVAMNSPMAQMVAMRMQQPQPVGVNQQMPLQESAPGGAPPFQQGMPQEAPEGSPGPPVHAGAAEGGPLDQMASAAHLGGNEALLIKYLPLLQKMYPDLKLADVKNGEAELTGPTQEQYLGAVHARSHGAKVHHVLNRGRGQRLHVRF